MQELFLDFLMKRFLYRDVRVYREVPRMPLKTILRRVPGVFGRFEYECA